MTMEQSILTSTKNVLGLAEDYEHFDHQIIIFINSAFSTLDQLGVGPTDGFEIEDKEAVWSDFDVPSNQLKWVRTLMFLKVRMLFDPPQTSYLIDAMTEQIEQLEWRLNCAREELVPFPEVEVEV